MNWRRFWDIVRCYVRGGSVGIDGGLCNTCVGAAMVYGGEAWKMVIGVNACCC